MLVRWCFLVRLHKLGGEIPGLQEGFEAHPPFPPTQLRLAEDILANVLAIGAGKGNVIAARAQLEIQFHQLAEVILTKDLAAESGKRADSRIFGAMDVALLSVCLLPSGEFKQDLMVGSTEIARQLYGLRTVLCHVARLDGAAFTKYDPDRAPSSSSAQAPTDGGDKQQDSGTEENSHAQDELEDPAVTEYQGLMGDDELGIRAAFSQDAVDPDEDEDVTDEIPSHDVNEDGAGARREESVDLIGFGVSIGENGLATMVQPVFVQPQDTVDLSRETFKR